MSDQFNFYKWAKHIIEYKMSYQHCRVYPTFVLGQLIFTENVQLIELYLFRNGSEYDILNQVNTEILIRSEGKTNKHENKLDN